MNRSTTRAARRGTPTIAIPARDRGATGDDQARSEGAAAATAVADPGRRLVPTVARWPLDIDGPVGLGSRGDAAIAIVQATLSDYRAGRADVASRVWHDDIAWSVTGRPPVGGVRTGRDGVFAYHALLDELSEGTFRQRLVALQGCRGATVDAYLRTTARRRGRELEIPTLAVFELAGGRIRSVTELPGDRDAWEAFWAD